MTLVEKAKLLLVRGVVLRILYKNPAKLNVYAMVCTKEFYNKIKSPLPLQCEYVDIFRKTKFEFPDETLIGFDCIDMPQGLFFADFLEDSLITNKFGLNFLFDNNEYIEKITNTVNTKEAEYIQYFIYHLEKYYTGNDDDIKDLLSIRFYPLSIAYSNRDDALEKVKNSISDQYHILEENGKPIIPALTQLGATTNDILQTNNENIIKAIKSQWYKMVSQERDIALENLENLRHEWVEANTGNEEDAFEQFKEYKQMLLDINDSIVSNCKTVPDIIKTWPVAIQPQPWYVYED